MSARETERDRAAEADLLVVDDTALNAQILASMLKQLGHRVRVAASGEAALAAVGRSIPDLVLLDVMMPGIDGLAVLHILKAQPDTRHVPVIMVSAQEDLGGIVQCIEGGAEDYLSKPVNEVLLRARVGACLERKRARDREREYHERTLRSAVRLMHAVLAAANPALHDQSDRVGRLAQRMARGLGMASLRELEVATMLSQVGALGLPAHVIEQGRRGLLTDPSEQAAFLAHPRVGARIVANLENLEEAVAIVGYQHKNWDGSGFPPDERRGEQIPLGARILRTALAFDDLIQLGLDPVSALIALRDQEGAHDPAVVRALAAVLMERA